MKKQPPAHKTFFITKIYFCRLLHIYFVFSQKNNIIENILQNKKPTKKWKKPTMQ